MKAKLLLSMIIAVISFSNLLAQSTDESAIKQTVRTETESYFKHDTTGWKSQFMQDEKITATYVSPNGYSHYTGWQNYGAPILEWMTKNPKADKYDDLKSDGYIIHVFGNAATAEYDQTIMLAADSGQPYKSHEFRTLTKDGDTWKIITLTSVDTSFNSLTLAGLENKINVAGYGFLGMKRTKDAIDVFKLNVKLFPKSYNVYDSLGEGYMDAGDNVEAIKNYEMSLKLNPENDNGKQMLVKLKKK